MAKKLSEGRKAGSGRKPGKAKTLAEGRKVGSGRKKGSVSKTLADGRKAGSGRKKLETSNIPPKITNLNNPISNNPILNTTGVESSVLLNPGASSNITDYSTLNQYHQLQQQSQQQYEQYQLYLQSHQIQQDQEHHQQQHHHQQQQQQQQQQLQQHQLQQPPLQHNLETTARLEYTQKKASSQEPKPGHAVFVEKKDSNLIEPFSHIDERAQAANLVNNWQDVSDQTFSTARTTHILNSIQNTQNDALIAVNGLVGKYNGPSDLTNQINFDDNKKSKLGDIKSLMNELDSNR